jgi:predicted  nucleic acid-binding Zn-ribbon protein
MAHQCLQCGKDFPDGSAELLKGCACGGTRFFYTQTPLPQAEREALRTQANHDIRRILQELARQGTMRPDYDAELWSNEARERWLRVDARKFVAHEPDAVEEVAGPGASAAQIGEPWFEQVEPAPRAAPPSEPGKSRVAKPEVVVVQEPGRYEIDVEQLLDKQPIVVRRDGVYVVHLPSVFASAGQRK